MNIASTAMITSAAAKKMMIATSTVVVENVSDSEKVCGQGRQPSTVVPLATLRPQKSLPMYASRTMASVTLTPENEVSLYAGGSVP